MNGREQILIESRLLTLTDEAAEQVVLPAKCETNQNGVRAWTVPAEQLTTFKQQLKALHGVSTARSLNVSTFDNGQAQVSDGSFTIDILPKVIGHSFSLLLSATSIDSIPLMDGTRLWSTTNLTAACRTLIPNGGGLVVASGTVGDLHGTNYWAIISVAAVDARGVRKGL